ncbi:alpha/beta hydrolase [Pseudogemmobacter faecipullorum]|uniref:Alpha/beta hydrolase n=1 Tax=Pseudogemmobacter faecipullorum TaxID=2755041 RepID=A0ABS8CI32_9RHOB|nr:alpha/beta hydrolase [Pseudogemmobacter faecipullorum]MCB5409053.1 alpha/beta hydrolase [Pseudogemmobacter faecipullorum]
MDLDRPDYTQWLDPAVRAFIARTGRFYPPETADFPIPEQRRIYDAMCAGFEHPHPPGLQVSDHTLAAVPCRSYRPAEPGADVQLVYAHGGGFVVGGLQSHDGICAEIAAQSGCALTSVDYRLSPEHPHPAALEDLLAVIAALPGDLVLIGDSAGGNLVAAACHRLRDPRLRGQVLIYPSLGRDRGEGSYIRHAHAPMLTRADLQFYAAIRHGGQRPDRGHPDFEPLSDRDFSGLPKTLAFAAECDPLADDPFLYAAAIRAAGGQALALCDRGLVHGWLRARHDAPRAAAAFHRIIKGIAALARDEWPDMEGEYEQIQQSDP